MPCSSLSFISRLRNILKVSKQGLQNRTNPPPLVAKQQVAFLLQTLHLTSRLRSGRKPIGRIPITVPRMVVGVFSFVSSNDIKILVQCGNYYYYYSQH
jgi:hypothetical protein